MDVNMTSNFYAQAPAPVQRDFDGSPMAKRARMDVDSSAGGSKVAVREEEGSSGFRFMSSEGDVFSIPTEVARRSKTVDNMLNIATAGHYPYQMDFRLNDSLIAPCVIF